MDIYSYVFAIYNGNIIVTVDIIWLPSFENVHAKRNLMQYEERQLLCCCSHGKSHAGVCCYYGRFYEMGSPII